MGQPVTCGLIRPCQQINLPPPPPCQLCQILPMNPLALAEFGACIQALPAFCIPACTCYHLSQSSCHPFMFGSVIVHDSAHSFTVCQVALVVSCDTMHQVRAPVHAASVHLLSEACTHSAWLQTCFQRCAHRQCMTTDVLSEDVHRQCCMTTDVLSEDGTHTAHDYRCAKSINMISNKRLSMANQYVVTYCKFCLVTWTHKFVHLIRVQFVH